MSFGVKMLKYYNMKGKWIVGIDEVGRGPLAGPLTVAAVAAPFIKHEAWITKQTNLIGIRDSKKLSALQRQVWNKKIRENFLYTLSSVSSQTIDRKGISYAAKLAVARSLKKLSIAYSLEPNALYVVLDGGLHAPSEYKNQRTIIRGDEREPLIAAASIIAKVRRDAYMTGLHKKIPMYGFNQHKG